MMRLVHQAVALKAVLSMLEIVNSIVKCKISGSEMVKMIRNN